MKAERKFVDTCQVKVLQGGMIKLDDHQDSQREPIGNPGLKVPLTFFSCENAATVPKTNDLAQSQSR